MRTRSAGEIKDLWYKEDYLVDIKLRQKPQDIMSRQDCYPVTHYKKFTYQVKILRK